MDFVSASLVGGVVYDLVKSGVSITARTLKEKLKDVILSEEEIAQLQVRAQEILKERSDIPKEQFIQKIAESLTHTSINVEENNGVVAGTINGGVNFHAK